MPTCQSIHNEEAKVTKYIGTRDFVSLAYLRSADCTTGSFSSHPARRGRRKEGSPQELDGASGKHSRKFHTIWYEKVFIEDFGELVQNVEKVLAGTPGRPES